MPRPFREITLEDVERMLRSPGQTRRIDAVHMHHTFRPTRADYEGLETVEAMWRFHTGTNGWSDIAQHVTVAPDGTIWTGRDWNRPPASSRGHNGGSAAGPFMFEMIGDFDRGRDPFDGAQREVVIGLVARVQEVFGLPLHSLRFHRQTSTKTCPGSSIERDEVLSSVCEERHRLRTRSRAAAVAGDLPFDASEAIPAGVGGTGAAGCGDADAEPAPAEQDQARPSYGGGAGSGGGRSRALCIGIDRYATAPLHGCVNDARDWRDALRSLGFEVRLMTDEEATRDGILGALGELVESARPGDRVVFQYSGHGTHFPDRDGDEDDRRDEALVPFDYTDGRYVLDDEQFAVLSRVRDGVGLTCFFDCCHSGSTTRFLLREMESPRGVADEDRFEVRFIEPTAEMLDLYARDEAGRSRSRAAPRGPDRRERMRWVSFGACRDDEQALERGGHGLFTTRAVGLLPDAVRRGVSHAELQRRIVDAFGRRPPQNPVLEAPRELRDRAVLGAPAGAATVPLGLSGDAWRHLLAQLPVLGRSQLRAVIEEASALLGRE